MFPIMTGRLMSFADVQYRQDELAREFAAGRLRRSRRQAKGRRWLRTTRPAAATTATAAAPAATLTATPIAKPTSMRAGSVAPRTPSAPTDVRAARAACLPTAQGCTTAVLDERLPVG